LTPEFADNEYSGSPDGDFEGYIEITNQTGHDFQYLYVSHENSDEWGDDVLEGDILEVGDSMNVDLAGYASSIFDVSAEDKDGGIYSVFGIDVSTDDLTITVDDLFY
jgi:hypothetical protein